MSTMDEISKEQRTWAMIAHVSGFAMYLTAIGHLVGPLIVWLAKRDGNPFIDDQGKEALNFQITVTIYFVVSGLLCLVVVGFFMLPVVGVFQIVCMIIAAIKASDGIAFRYPLTLRLVK